MYFLTWLPWLKYRSVCSQVCADPLLKELFPGTFQVSLEQKWLQSWQPRSITEAGAHAEPKSKENELGSKATAQWKKVFWDTWEMSKFCCSESNRLMELKRKSCSLQWHDRQMINALTSLCSVCSLLWVFSNLKLKLPFLLFLNYKSVGGRGEELVVVFFFLRSTSFEFLWGVSLTQSKSDLQQWSNHYDSLYLHSCRVKEDLKQCAANH